MGGWGGGGRGRVSEGSQYLPNQAILTESDDFWPDTLSDRTGQSRLGGVSWRRRVPTGAELRVRRSTSTSTWSSLSSSPLSSSSTSSPTGRLLPRPPSTRLSHSSSWQSHYAPTRSRLARHDAHLVRLAAARIRTGIRARTGASAGQDEGLCAQPVELAGRYPHRRQPRFPRPGAKFARIRRRVHSNASGLLCSAAQCKQCWRVQECILCECMRARVRHSTVTRSISTSYEANMCLHYCLVRKDAWLRARSATSITRLCSNRVELN